MQLAQSFTLRELVQHEPFDLELLTGGEESLDRAVSGAHTVDVDNPARWLGRGWIMLTTGIQLKGMPGRQIALVDELIAADVAAIGFAENLVFEKTPELLLERAADRGFPVFSVPLTSPFKDVISFVHSALLSSEFRTMQRLSSIQIYLMDALREQNPLEIVLDRLATGLDSVAALLTVSGETVGSAGEMPVDAIWPRLEPQSEMTQEITVGEWLIVAALVKIPERRSPYWLLVGSRRRSPWENLRKDVLKVTVPLIIAILRLEQGAAAQIRIKRRALFHQLLAGNPGPDLERELAAAGIENDEPIRVVSVSWPNGMADLPEEEDRETMLDEIFLEAGLPSLSAAAPAGLVAMVESDDARLSSALEQIHGVWPGVRIGVGRMCTDLSMVPTSRRDADLATEISRPAEVTEQVTVWFETMAFTSLLVSTLPEVVEERLKSLRAELERNPTLLETISVYFEERQDVARVAERLFLHPNTVRYRLRRVESIADGSLKEAETVTLLHLVLSSP